MHVRVRVIGAHTTDGVGGGGTRLGGTPSMTAHVAGVALARARVQVISALALARGIVSDVAGVTHARVSAAGGTTTTGAIMALVGAEGDAVIAERALRVVRRRGTRRHHAETRGAFVAANGRGRGGDGERGGRRRSGAGPVAFIGVVFVVEEKLIVRTCGGAWGRSRQDQRRLKRGRKGGGWRLWSRHWGMGKMVQAGMGAKGVKNTAVRILCST